MSKRYDLVVLPPQDKPVYFILERKNYPDQIDTDDARRFFYESHSCPTNWLDPEYMVHDGQNDPHGLIQYVGSRQEATLPPDETCSPNDRTEAFDRWVAEEHARRAREEPQK